MKTKSSSNSKKQNVAVKDLQTRKNPKGGINDPIPGVDVVVKKKPRP